MSARPGRSAPAHVTHLRTTPVKGFTMRESPSLFLTETGVVGDRAFFMVDDADKLLSATRTPSFLSYWARFDPDREVLAIGRKDDVLLSEVVTDAEPVRAHFFGARYATGHVVPGPWSEVLSEIAGRRVRLVRAADPLGGYDLHRVSLASEASVEALAGEGDAGRLDGRRFRMTVTIVPSICSSAAAAAQAARRSQASRDTGGPWWPACRASSHTHC